MDFRADKVEGAFARLDELVAGLLPHVSATIRPAVERWRGDVGALKFHLGRGPRDGPILLVVLGGTGTGKSTLVNRILGQTVSATSFRRTFTSGAVAVAEDPSKVPDEWLGVEHVTADPAELPARGRIGALLVAPVARDITRHLTLIDTPDLDGDQPAHHAEADRAFRWAEAVLFLVTPEKYQMTELLPYYRVAARYKLPAVFVMNKAEQQPVIDDYARLLRTQGSADADGNLFALPRDDAGFEPPPEQNLQSLRESLLKLNSPTPAERAEGLRSRSEDLLGRAGDQILAPLREDRREIDQLIASLRGMEAPVPGVDVNPLTQQLQRRMQQRSVLYLMGPQRMLDRVRQAPGLLVRLPRVAWDYLLRGELSAASLNSHGKSDPREAPDFKAILTDQFAVLQSRLDDALRSNNLIQRWSKEGSPAPYQSALLDPAEAGKIAEEELAELNRWLEQRWNATPRDTRILQSLVKYLPGGKKITQWSEAAPYLLVLIVAAATHHLFGGVDFIVLGGWSLATWLSERLSNEVAAHTRQTNQKITDRFARLAHDQIERLTRWLDEQAPDDKGLDQLERAIDAARETTV
ncbi:MAG TPA: GTPase domain-containing protein [Tepidisphaeraceae bacterium]|nr:GTPase domain-containing protein [Tepidisphaeraceae bacterium]